MKELIPFSAKGFSVCNLIIVPLDFTSISMFVISYLITFTSNISLSGSKFKPGIIEDFKMLKKSAAGMKRSLPSTITVLAIWNIFSSITIKLLNPLIFTLLPEIYKTSFFLSEFSYIFEDSDDDKFLADIYKVFPTLVVLISDSIFARRLKTCTSPAKVE